MLVQESTISFDEMAISLDHKRIIEQLQREMALKESGAEGPIPSEKRHPGCTGHGCSPACGYHGYCDYEATRYYSSPKGQAESENRKEVGHTYYRRSMRLGYDSEDD